MHAGPLSGGSCVQRRAPAAVSAAAAGTQGPPTGGVCFEPVNAMMTFDMASKMSSGSGRTSACLGRNLAVRWSRSHCTALPFSGMNFAPIPACNQPFFRAALCEQFLRLRDERHFTVTGAARALGRSASSFSGEGSMLQRYLRGGLAGLTRRGRGAGTSDLATQIESLDWFVPAAQFFYFSAHRRRGALVGAVRRAAALPSLPLGWRRETRARFLARLNLEAPPECPASLRGELATREREAKPIVPPRITRLIKSTPASIRRHCIETPVEELARVNFSAILTRLAENEPGRVCRLTIDLL